MKTKIQILSWILINFINFTIARNTLLIIADDYGLEAGCMGNSVIRYLWGNLFNYWLTQGNNTKKENFYLFEDDLTKSSQERNFGNRF